MSRLSRTGRQRIRSRPPANREYALSWRLEDRKGLGAGPEERGLHGDESAKDREGS